MESQKSNNITQCIHQLDLWLTKLKAFEANAEYVSDTLGGDDNDNHEYKSAAELLQSFDGNDDVNIPLTLDPDHILLTRSQSNTDLVCNKYLYFFRLCLQKMAN